MIDAMVSLFLAVSQITIMFVVLFGLIALPLWILRKFKNWISDIIFEATH